MKKNMLRAVTARRMLPLVLLAGILGPAGGLAAEVVEVAEAAGAVRPPAAGESPPGDLAFKKATPGVTPFISFAKFAGGASIARTASVSYKIAPAPGAQAKAVKVRYAMSWLQAHGRVLKDGSLVLPVFGLYANRVNDVAVTFVFDDGTKQDLPIQIATAPYTDPHGLYDHPQIVQPLDPGVALAYSYIYIKASKSTPVILDTDARIRWVATGIDDSFSSAFLDNGFTIGSHDGPIVYRLELDGTRTKARIESPTIEHFQHNITPGREARLGGVDTLIDGVENIQSTVIEVADDGTLLRTWDFAQILGDYMRAHGDDPSGFVRPGDNWLHINSQIYDPSDDTLVISSREQFVLKIGYDSRDIVWILGDPTKYWNTFPSLRAKGLAIGPKGAYVPIGQHDIKFDPQGDLLMFNNGMPTMNLPPGAPPGQSRKFSVVSAYRIDATQMQAMETERYRHQKTLLSRVCGSATEVLLDAGGGTQLIDYAAAAGDTEMHLVGLGADGRMAFEYVYPTNDCGTGWNAQPIPFDGMDFE
jgi:hypothetical protein